MKSLTATAILGLLLAVLNAAAAPVDEDKSPIDARNFDMEVLVSKQRKMSGTDYDNKMQNLDVTLKVTNRTARETFSALRAKVYLIGESASKDKHYRLLHVHEESFDLGAREDKKIAAGALRLEYDDNEAARFGYKYEGYVVVLRDSDGKLIAVKSPKSLFSANLEELAKMRKGTAFDKKFKPVAAPMFPFMN